jgi:VCBS repeat-containing protein
MTESYSTYSGFGIALTFTPSSGTYSGVTIPLDGAHDIKTPGRKRSKGEWTPLTGPEAGVKQPLSGALETEEFQYKTPYQPARFAQLDALAKDAVPGTLVVIMADGQTQTASGFISDVRKDNITDAPPITMTVTAEVKGNWTLGSSTLVPFTQALTAGTATMDLTNVGGVDGTGKTVACMMVLAAAGNANAYTIAKGVTNGYAGLGAGFTATLAPGQDAAFYSAPTPAVIGGTNKTFTCTGTGSQSISGCLWLI